MGREARLVELKDRDGWDDETRILFDKVEGEQVLWDALAVSISFLSALWVRHVVDRKTIPAIAVSKFDTIVAKQDFRRTKKDAKAEGDGD